jgi:hypothetical protein
MKVDLRNFELQNIVRTPAGLRTRKGMSQFVAATGGTRFVAGFTMESPSTTEPLHFLFEQNTTTGSVTLRVYTEEFFELSNYSIGVMQKDPVITWAVANNQYMINSPSFATPLYGIVGGGGPVAAVKTASINPDTTALDIPSGHICSFGDRFAIAAGNVVLFNDPPSASNLDPRTFVGLTNSLTLPGAVYDLFQGNDGALRIFTSAGVFSLPTDAIGNGQSVQGFLSRVPGLDTSRSRNACACAGAGVVLQRDRVVVLGDEGNPINLAPYSGRRLNSGVVAVDDLRLAGELYPTPTGFIVGFRGKRGHYVDVDIASRTFSYYTAGGVGSGFNVVGTLRSRDGEALIVCNAGVIAPTIAGFTDAFTGNTIIGTACGKIPTTGARPTVRRIHVATQGSEVTAYVSGKTKDVLTTKLAGEAQIGPAQWSASSTPLAGRQTRAVRASLAAVASEPHLELSFYGSDRLINPNVDIETEGQGSGRGDVNR